MYVSEGKVCPFRAAFIGWLWDILIFRWNLLTGICLLGILSVMVTSAALLFTENYLPWMSIFSHKSFRKSFFASDSVHYASAIFLWCYALQNTCSCISICNAVYDTYTFSSSASAHTWSHAHISWYFFCNGSPSSSQYYELDKCWSMSHLHWQSHL